MRRNGIISTSDPKIVTTVLSNIVRFRIKVLKFWRYDNISILVDFWPHFYCTRTEMAISEFLATILSTLSDPAIWNSCKSGIFWQSE